MTPLPARRGPGLWVQRTVTYLQKKAENVTFGFPENPHMKGLAVI